MEDYIVDGIKLDPENKEFKYALDCVQYTNQLIYLTGKAGTGKTTFLKYLRKVTSKKMVVLAPTGVAAVNAKGQTLHSFFHIPISLFVPDDRRLNQDFYETFRYKSDRIKMIRNLELLVIDEVSMVRCDLLDVVDIILRRIRKKNNIPFGGVQVLLIGDTFQLPPVVTPNDWSVLYRFYDSEFFFSAKAMSKVKPLYIELKKVYRQKEQEFIDVLNRIRVGKHNNSDIHLLNTRLDVDSSSAKSDNYITLTTTNARADSENSKKLEALPSESAFFKAQITGNFPENNYPTDSNLELKVGTQVMFIKNNWVKGYFNGKIGKVSKFNDESITVDITDEHNEIVPINVEPFTWENVLYAWNEEEKTIEETVTGTFKQYPLKLAWAITVHKSQGMTFEKVIADVGWSFAAGQVYVALSRCTSMNGLILKSRITPQAIKTDSRVIAFARNEVPETLILEELQKGKADFYYAEARKCLKVFDGEGCYDNFVKALNYRNDIETSSFRRFVFVWLRRFEKLIEDFKSLKTENDKMSIEIISQKKEIATLIEEKECLEKEKCEHEEKIQQLGKKVITLNSILTEKEKTIHTKDGEIQSLSSQIDILRKDNESFEVEVQSLKREKRALQNVIYKNEQEKKLVELELAAQARELDRVRKIKWYQKLLGKE